ncbi:intradiol ring-cleavage dioxygenase [Zeaxanthinibacter sp. PT1]|uniref:dioxygenase family protein n=1 Tax=Zeaxanthinibacter TaxID=561554 RepID=UPI002349BFC6|nr:intradiol ring-cleavage dioxygenase [Zeaxanthinibacter sp. PT1]MDC6351053.1 intradiol ring-cleavage dioxygenase [Zeaxanthinibacter sp. PT1]
MGSIIRIKAFGFLFLVSFLACCGQDRGGILGGPCEGCEAVHDYGDRVLSPVDTLPLFGLEPRLRITGTVFKKDGKTPAEDVILYIYQTDRQGIYRKIGEEKGWGLRHGSIRGWVKTGADGRYTFYTFRPGAYPDRGEPEHIHLTIKEPGKKEYYVDDYTFEDDILLTEERRKRMRNRAGSGIVMPTRKEGIYVVERDLFLGINIPNYE